MSGKASKGRLQDRYREALSTNGERNQTKKKIIIFAYDKNRTMQ